MNRRVLAALVTLADVHEARETASRDEEEERAAIAHGRALLEMRESDDVLYHDLAARLCGAEETLLADPLGGVVLEKARGRSLT